MMGGVTYLLNQQNPAQRCQRVPFLKAALP